MLTKEAFNALLKTLEEPPEHVIFIMATTDAYKVPVTITSRAQTYTFKLADESVMFTHLKNICEKESIKIDDDALRIVVRRGGGSFRDSISLLDQISTLSDGEITKAQVISAMGLPEDERIAALIDAYIGSDFAAVSANLKALFNTGVKPETLTEELISSIIHAPRPELMPLLSKLPEVRAPYAEAKLLVALCPPGAAVVPAVGTGSTGSCRPSASAACSTNASAGPTDSYRPPASGLVSSRTPDAEPLAEPSPRANSPIDFSWEEFVGRVKAADEGIASQLSFVSHDVADGTLNLYPDKSFVYKSLSRDKNKAILIENACGLKVAVHEVGTSPNAKKDELISKMSDIMGGEVTNDEGDNPF